jgi:outer membrane protein assembly factor BamB
MEVQVSGDMHGLPNVTADIRWQNPSGAATIAPFVGGAPVVVGGAIYQVWNVSGIHNVPGPEIMVLRSYDAATGTLRWQADLPRDIVGTTPSTGPVVAPPAVAGGRIVVATIEYIFANGVNTYHSQLAAYSTATGSRLWSVTTSPDGTNSSQASSRLILRRAFLEVVLNEDGVQLAVEGATTLPGRRLDGCT